MIILIYSFNDVIDGSILRKYYLHKESIYEQGKR